MTAKKENGKNLCFDKACQNGSYKILCYLSINKYAVTKVIENKFTFASSHALHCVQVRKKIRRFILNIR